MKHLGRIIVVSVILAIFAAAYIFCTAVERKADSYEKIERARAVQKIQREVFSVHLCRGEFLTSCRGVTKEACSLEILKNLEECRESESSGKDAVSLQEQSSAIVTCAFTRYFEVHPERIKQDAACAEPEEVDQKALRDDILAAINKL